MKEICVQYFSQNEDLSNSWKCKCGKEFIQEKNFSKCRVPIISCTEKLKAFLNDYLANNKNVCVLKTYFAFDDNLRFISVAL